MVIMLLVVASSSFLYGRIYVSEFLSSRAAAKAQRLTAQFVSSDLAPVGVAFIRLRDKEENNNSVISDFFKKNSRSIWPEKSADERVEDDVVFTDVEEEEEEEEEVSTIVLSASSIVEEVARAVAEEGKLGRLNGKNYEKSKKPARAVRSASPSPVKKAAGIVSNYGKVGVQRRNSDFAVAPPTAWSNLKPLQVH